MLCFIITTLIFSTHFALCASEKSIALNSQTRQALIEKAAQSCKIPCWQSTCQEQYPLCPLSTCNQAYDETIDSLLSSQETTSTGCKRWGITTVRKGYTCKLIYPIANIIFGKSVKNTCLNTLIACNIPYACLCTNYPMLSYCLLGLGCSLAAKKCDLCVLERLSSTDGTPKPCFMIDI